MGCEVAGKHTGLKLRRKLWTEVPDLGVRHRQHMSSPMESSEKRVQTLGFQGSRNEEESTRRLEAVHTDGKRQKVWHPEVKEVSKRRK